LGKLTFFHILYQSAVRYLNVLNSPFSSSSITFFSVINIKSTKKHQKAYQLQSERLSVQNPPTSKKGFELFFMPIL
ncbi:hypothetical protein ACYT7O_10195, partial [Streptococcus pyogenes]